MGRFTMGDADAILTIDGAMNAYRGARLEEARAPSSERVRCAAQVARCADELERVCRWWVGLRDAKTPSNDTATSE